MTVINAESPPTLDSFNPRGGKVYPAPGTRLGRGWAAVWRLLAEVPEGEYVFGGEVTAPAVHKVRPPLHEVTLLNLMNRMVAGGILESEKRPVTGARGVRVRNFYRIKR